MDQAPGATEPLRPGPERTCVFYQGSREPAAGGQSLPLDVGEVTRLTKTKQRNKSAQRYARVQRKTTWYGDLPLLPIIVGGLLLVGAIAIIVFANLNKAPAAAGGSIDGIPCNSSEQLAVHYHAYLEIVVAGNDALIPANTGINQDQQCLYWMHTHDTSGVIHIEAPQTSATRKFTLGEFFDIWGKKLDRTHVGDTTISGSQKLVVFVDGQEYTGNPRAIVLGKHTQVVLEVTPPQVSPSTYTFPAGL